MDGCVANVEKFISENDKVLISDESEKDKANHLHTYGTVRHEPLTLPSSSQGGLSTDEGCLSYLVFKVQVHQAARFNNHIQLLLIRLDVRLDEKTLKYFSCKQKM